jgi:hypothetical protein
MQTAMPAFIAAFIICEPASVPSDSVADPSDRFSTSIPA